MSEQGKIIVTSPSCEAQVAEALAAFEASVPVGKIGPVSVRASKFVEEGRALVIDLDALFPEADHGDIWHRLLDRT